MTLAIIFESVGAGEWLVLLAVLLIVVGPKNLPSTIRKFGQHYAKFKRAAESFKRQLMEMDTEINNAVSEAEREADNAVKEFTVTDDVDSNPYPGTEAPSEAFSETGPETEAAPEMAPDTGTASAEAPSEHTDEAT